MGQIKSIIKNIYSIISKTGIIYYVKKVELRCYISKKFLLSKEKLFLNFLKKFSIFVLTITLVRMKLEIITIMIAKLYLIIHLIIYIINLNYVYLILIF